MLGRTITLCLCLGLAATAMPAAAQLTAAPGYEATELYSSAGTCTTIGGLDYHDGKLYFGQYTEIKALDLSDGTSTTVGNVPSNAGNAFVTVKPDDDTVYTSYGESYDFPYPYKTGYLDPSGVYQHQLDMDGVYDAAVNSAGELFIVANPMANGSRIYQYDWSSGSTREVANVGGSTGGLTFDDADNLYYSAYDVGKVIRFEAAEVEAGGLGIDDATTVLALESPGFLAFNDRGHLFATNFDASWNTHVSLYDATTGTMIAEVADGGGKLTWHDDTLYTIDTDWGAYASTIEAITEVPEPSVLVLLGMAGIVLLGKRAGRPM